jgi:hypothetical protein
MEALNSKLGTRVSSVDRCAALSGAMLLGALVREDLLPIAEDGGEEASAITMRPGWLARAAFVFCISREPGATSYH